MKQVICNFCGKSDKEVLKMIRGADAVICNECVCLCVEVLCGGKNYGSRPEGTKPKNKTEGP